MCKKFDLDSVNYVLSFKKKGVNCIEIKVNGEHLENIMWGHLECELSKALKKGKNTIELTIVNNLRNMLGPHHLPIGESYWVTPWDFYKKRNVWNHALCGSSDKMEWDDNYCFAEFGISLD